jgi:hypothetical protein
MTTEEHVQNVWDSIVAHTGMSDVQRDAVNEALLDAGAAADASRDECVRLSRALERFRRYCRKAFK